MKSNVDFSPYTLAAFEKPWEEELVALIGACYAEYGQTIELDTLDSDLLKIEEVYSGPGSAFCVLLRGGRLVASVAVKRTGGREAELKRLFVDPGHRRRGLGRKLSLWARGFAEAQGFDVLHVWSDVLYDKAHALYRSLGADDTGKRRSLGGVNSVDEFYFEWRIDR